MFSNLKNTIIFKLKFIWSIICKIFFNINFYLLYISMILFYSTIPYIYHIYVKLFKKYEPSYNKKIWSLTILNLLASIIFTLFNIITAHIIIGFNYDLFLEFIGLNDTILVIVDDLVINYTFMYILSIPIALYNTVLYVINTEHIKDFHRIIGYELYKYIYRNRTSPLKLKLTMRLYILHYDITIKLYNMTHKNVQENLILNYTFNSINILSLNIIFHYYRLKLIDKNVFTKYINSQIRFINIVNNQINYLYSHYYNDPEHIEYQTMVYLLEDVHYHKLEKNPGVEIDVINNHDIHDYFSYKFTKNYDGSRHILDDYFDGFYSGNKFFKNKFQHDDPIFCNELYNIYDVIDIFDNMLKERQNLNVLSEIYNS